MGKGQQDLDGQRLGSFADFRSAEWIDNEVVGCEFQDVCHGKRLRQALSPC